MPESIRSCGETNAPAERITSPSVRTVLLLAVLLVVDTGRAAVLDEDVTDAGAGDHLEIGISRERREKGIDGAASPPAARGRLQVADAGGISLVEVGRVGEAHPLHRPHIDVAHLADEAGSDTLSGPLVPWKRLLNFWFRSSRVKCGRIVSQDQRSVFAISPQMS